MRQLGTRVFIAIGLLLSCTFGQAQFSFNCSRDTTINFCNNSQCISLKALIPDIHAHSTSYTVNPTSSTPGCFPVYAQPDDPAGTPSGLTIDDKYSGLIDIGFPFVFYDASYNQLVASTNGYVCFDLTRATLGSHYQILNNSGSLSSSTGTPLDMPTTLYDKALIMGPYHDLDPSVTTSAARRIQYQVVGTAPHRRWILSFYKVPLFNCNAKIQNTHQIVLYESTGMVEVLIFDKEICTTWNQGRSLIGMQNMTRDQAIEVPGRTAADAPWGTVGMNESYRFTPSAGASLFKRVELYDLAGTLISTGTTAPAGSGSLQATFPNLCPPVGTTSYIVKSVYQKIDDQAVEVFGADTIRVTRTSSTNLNATASMNPAACGPNGSITVSVQSGIGTPPFAYALDGGTPVNTPNRSQTFTGLVAGSHTVVVTDASGCSSTVTITVGTTGTLQVTPAIQPTSCQGAANGSVTLTPQNGVSPFQYNLNGSGWQPGNSFTNLSPGTYLVSIKDAGGCVLNDLPVTIQSGAPLAPTWAINPPSCSGAANGSITLNNPTNGQGPYQYQINGGGYGTNNVFSNLPPGTYVASVKDAQGCSVNLALTVPNGTGSLSATATPVGTSCPGANNGSITITAQSGSGPYQYSVNGGSFQSGNVATGLAAGNYTVVLKDGAGCTTSPISVTVTAGTALLATASATDAACTGVNNGKITVTPTNGAGPYTYALDGGTPQASNIFNGVSAGAHTVVVTDGAGCVTAPITVTVNTAAAVNGTPALTATSCNGASDGQLVITPTNGTSPYQYSVDGGTFQAGATFTGLTAASHTFVVKDAAGCTSAPVSFTITPGATLTGSATSSTTSCTGVSNGTITATFNGTPAQVTQFQPQYALDGGGYQASNVFTGVSAGAHQVVIKSVNGCQSAPIPVTVTVGPPLTATTASAPTSCTGANDGTVTVTPPTSGGPFTYSINGNPFQSAPTFTGLAAGNYTVIMKDPVGCTTNSMPITVGAGSVLTATFTTVATSCSGATDGTVTVTPPGNGGPFTYSFNGGTFQTGTGTFTALAAGTYTIVVKNAAGCVTNPITATVSAGQPLTATYVATSTSCSGANNGTITVTPQSVGGPFTYSINGGAFQSGATFNALAAGTYTIVVKNSLGCTTAPISATVPPGQPITATTTVIDVACNGGNNGSVTLTVPTSATPPIQYSLDNTTFQPGATFNGLTAGSYTAYFKDNNGCAGSQTFTVIQPSVLAGSTTIRNVSCNGLADGLIRGAGSGGTSPYQYSINGTTYQTADSFLLAAGTYTLYVKDSKGCVKQLPNQVITEPAVLTATATTTNSTCAGGSDGTITVTATGGTSGYTYSVNGGAFQSSNVFNVLSGTYSILVKDAHGCTVPLTRTVTLNNNLVVTPVPDTTICQGTGIALYPNTNATQFTWTPTAGITTGATTAQPFVQPDTSTTYTVTATLGVCSAQQSIRVNVRPAPVADAGAAGEICYGQTYTLQGSGGVVYQWSGPDFVSTATGNPVVVKPKITAEYSLSVTDANGCRSLQPAIVHVGVIPPFVVNISKDTAVAFGDQIQLHAQSIAPNYLWTPSYGLDDPTKPNPIATINADITYTVVASTAAGCTGTASVTIKVYQGPEIYMATAFTPNNDGKNDRFTPFPVGIKKYNYFRVFNRWGQLVFSTTEFNKGWDGKMGNQDQPSGTYIWIIEGVTKDDKLITKRGTVVLIR